MLAVGEQNCNFRHWSVFAITTVARERGKLCNRTVVKARDYKTTNPTCLASFGLRRKPCASLTPAIPTAHDNTCWYGALEEGSRLHRAMTGGCTGLHRKAFVSAVAVHKFAFAGLATKKHQCAAGAADGSVLACFSEGSCRGYLYHTGDLAQCQTHVGACSFCLNTATTEHRDDPPSPLSACACHCHWTPSAVRLTLAMACSSTRTRPGPIQSNIGAQNNQATKPEAMQGATTRFTLDRLQDWSKNMKVSGVSTPV